MLLAFYKSELDAMIPLVKISILYLLVLFFNNSLAQEVKITKLELQGNDVVIYYDLLDENLEHKYSLHLYSSYDNYIQPLELVEGDIGVEIAVGVNKKVIWHAREEFGKDIPEDIAFELQGNIYIPFIALDGFEDYQVFKRGKPYDISWTGGRRENVLIYELYQGNRKVKVFEERPNEGKTKLTIPTDVKPGKDYKFKISDKRNRDEVIYSGIFEIKRKVPLGLKLGIGIAATGAVGAYIITRPVGEKEISEPPLPSR